VAFLEVRPGIPIGAHNHIAFAIVIEIPKVPALRPEMRSYVVFFPGMELVLGCREGKHRREAGG
jgi:hypothetical protein